jgi:hypothetical protein
MNIIGNIAALLFVITGLLMISPLLLIRSIKESYERFDFWEFMHDLPTWVPYLLIGWLTILFWVMIGYLFLS